MAYYTPTGKPLTNSSALSAQMRAEFVSIAAGFSLLPTVAGNQDQLVVIDSTGSALVGSPQLTLTSGNLNISGGSVATDTSLIVGADQVVAARDTGWTAMTGTSDKASVFDTSSVTLSQLASRVLSLQAALATHGLIGATGGGGVSSMEMEDASGNWLFEDSSTVDWG
jgi:hypothetical protein